MLFRSNTLDLIVIQSDLHQIVQIFLLRVYMIILIFLCLQNILFCGGSTPIWIKRFLTSQNIEIRVTQAILHQFPRFFMSRAHKDIPEFSVYSEYFISWGDRRYRFYKVVESMSHIKNLKRLTSLMGSKEGRHSKIFSFSHFWSLSGYLSPRSLGYPHFPFLPCRDRNQVSMVVRATSPWSQDLHLLFSI